MTHIDTALNTKQAMASSLKKYMGSKPLSKITVSEICTDCGMNRKTFYYHFKDIYDLLRWMLEGEALTVVKKFDLLVDYREVIGFVIDYVDKNNHILTCAYDAMGREGMKRFFFSDFQGAIGVIIHGMEEKKNVVLDKDFRQFLCDFYTNALSGMLIDWFHDRSVRSREEMIEYIILTIRTSLPAVISARAGASSKQ